MHVTGQTPVKVNVFAVHSEVQAQYEFRHNCDAFAMMNCITDGGALMSTVGILAWRSCLENGRTIALPDFRKKEDRDAIRDDALTPFPDENGRATLPCAAGKAVNGC